MRRNWYLKFGNQDVFPLTTKQCFWGSICSLELSLNVSTSRQRLRFFVFLVFFKPNNNNKTEEAAFF